MSVSERSSAEASELVVFLEWWHLVLGVMMLLPGGSMPVVHLRVFLYLVLVAFALLASTSWHDGMGPVLISNLQIVLMQSLRDSKASWCLSEAILLNCLVVRRKAFFVWQRG